MSTVMVNDKPYPPCGGDYMWAVSRREGKILLSDMCGGQYMSDNEARELRDAITIVLERGGGG